MKGTFFARPLEWSIETQGESWQQGSVVSGTLKVKNHGPEKLPLTRAGVGLAYADIKKIHSRTEGALDLKAEWAMEKDSIAPGESLESNFSLNLPENCAVTDKKASFYLTYGQNLTEGHLQLKVEPLALFSKVTNLLDTFHRFKLKEVKAAKNGVDYKFLPPASKDMANLDALTATFSLKNQVMKMVFEFQVKKLDTSSVTTKINKETVKLTRELSPKEYSLGRDMINQDQLLKVLESVLNEVKLNNRY